jgi:hypothetical protein
MSESNTVTACSGGVQQHGQAFSAPVTDVTSEPVIKMFHTRINVIQLLRTLIDCSTSLEEYQNMCVNSQQI